MLSSTESDVIGLFYNTSPAHASTDRRCNQAGHLRSERGWRLRPQHFQEFSQRAGLFLGLLFDAGFGQLPFQILPANDRAEAGRDEAHFLSELILH